MIILCYLCNLKRIIMSYYSITKFDQLINFDQTFLSVISRLRIVMHLKSVKYACKYALKTAKICTKNAKICT
jgi:hypothetical protein